MDTTVQIKGDQPLRDRLEKSPRVLADVIEKNMRALGIIVAAKERRVLEVVKYTGGLAHSVSVTFDGSLKGARVVIAPTAKNAMFVRMGTKPHWAPIGPLKEWAKWKLGDENAAYAVQKSIARHGTSTWIERRGLGDGFGGYDYPQRTLDRGDVQLGITRASQHIGIQLVGYIESGSVGNVEGNSG